MNLKGLIQTLTDIEKESLNEAATLTISADTGQEIGDVLRSMQSNAGIQSKPVGGDMPMPMRKDIEKFRAAVDDDPTIPGKDDVDGDQDLQAGVLGTLGGAALGGAAGNVAGAASGATDALGRAGASLGSKAGGALAKAIGKDTMGQIGGRMAGAAAGNAIGRAAPTVAGATIGGAIGNKMTGDEKSKKEAIKADLHKALANKKSKK